MTRAVALAAALFGLLALGAPFAAADEARPDMLRDVGIEQRLDAAVPLDLPFRDESGAAVRLGDYFGEKPVLLQFAYFHCPMLCPLAFEGMVRSLRPLSWTAGDQFTIVTVGIDPRETPALAAERKRSLVEDYGRAGVENGWHLLTGDAASIEKLAAAVGFRWRYDAEHDQYAHAAGVVFLTPQGRVSRYLYGIDYAPLDVRLALVESSERKIGTLADVVLLFCYHYDAAAGRYGAAVMTGVRTGGVLTVLVLGVFLGRQFRSDARAAKAAALRAASPRAGSNRLQV